MLLVGRTESVQMSVLYVFRCSKHKYLIGRLLFPVRARFTFQLCLRADGSRSSGHTLISPLELILGPDQSTWKASHFNFSNSEPLDVLQLEFGQDTQKTVQCGSRATEALILDSSTLVGTKNGPVIGGPLRISFGRRPFRVFGHTSVLQR
jgi:hypothetical protein